MPYLYRHIRLDKNEPFYIGIGSSNNYKRAYSIYLRNKHWQNIVSKSDYRVEILFDDLTWQKACEKEKEFIFLYGRKDNKTGILCNMTNGGEGAYNRIVSEETRRKISKSNSGKVRTEEVKNKLRIISTGQKGYWLGKKRSEETKEKLRNIKLGKKRAETNIGSSKLIFNTVTGIYYDTIHDAAKSCNLTYSNLQNMLSGYSKNKTSFIYGC
jgi:hypothetical protein